MEPLSAMAVAGNVLQFVDFGQKLIAKILEVYKAADGLSKDHRQLDTAIRGFILLQPRILENERGGKNPTTEFDLNSEGVGTVEKTLVAQNILLGQPMTTRGKQADDEMARIANACCTLSNDLLHRLEKLKIGGKHKAWKSLKVALSSFGEESEILRLLTQLERHKKNLEWHVMIALREEVSLMSSRQADQFETSRQTMKAIEQLLHRTSLEDTLASYVHTLAHVSREQENTCERMTQTIEKALQDRGISKFRESSLVNPSVTSDAAGRFAKDLLKIETEILESLRFSLMVDREEEIRQAERATFEWIYRNPRREDLPWDNFAEWLQKGDNLYWVTGKAASGKSTLMKYLFSNTRTIQLLQRWSGHFPIIIAGFFFWNSGGTLQKSQEGLLRSLLYQCLSGHRELIPAIFSNTVKVDSTTLKDFWTATRLKQAFSDLVHQKLVPMKLCFFIDGLDEYSGDHKNMSEILRQTAAAPNVKMCVSSRPLLVFERGFQGLPGLMLQNLTFEDIQTYVTHQFSENVVMKRLQVQEPGFGKRLALEITEKATGVFLWVRLVVESLLEGIENYDRGSDLLRRLRELPEDLEELYWHMLKMVKPAFYLEQASKLLLIIYNAKKPFTLLQLAYADLEDENFAIAADFMHFTNEQKDDMCLMMEGRLKSRCLGLLEIPAYASVSTLRINKLVQFMHQSVADFLERAQVKKRMADCLQGHNFNPNICLMRTTILELKHLSTKIQDSERQPGIFMAQVWFKKSWPMIETFADLARRIETDTSDPDTLLLDELDRVAGHLWDLYVSAEGRYRTRQGFHWSQWKREGDFPVYSRGSASFLSFLATHGLYQSVHQYLEPGVWTSRKKTTRAELDYAIFRISSKPEIVNSQIYQDLLQARKFDIRASIQSLLIVSKVLLRRPAYTNIQ